MVILYYIYQLFVYEITGDQSLFTANTFEHVQQVISSILVFFWQYSQKYWYHVNILILQID